MRFYQPLLSDDSHDQGDPFPVRDGDRYLTFTTAQDQTGAFATYEASLDFAEVRYLGMALEREADAAHWAAWVGFSEIVGWAMLYSRSLGSAGDAAHIGHRIYLALADQPAGPYKTVRCITPGGDDNQSFFIDPDVQLVDGRLMFACATDYVDDEPFGTGIAWAPISDDLSHLLEPLQPILRATTDYHVYESQRVMPWKHIPGIDWEQGQTAKWHTVEAPVILSPDVVLYSGGNFSHQYFVGAAVRQPDGTWRDSVQDGHFVVSPGQIPGFTSPGHCAKVPDQDMLIMAGLPDGCWPRKMFLAPLAWNARGLPFCPTP